MVAILNWLTILKAFKGLEGRRIGVDRVGRELKGSVERRQIEATKRFDHFC